MTSLPPLGMIGKAAALAVVVLGAAFAGGVGPGEGAFPAANGRDTGSVDRKGDRLRSVERRVKG